MQLQRKLSLDCSLLFFRKCVEPEHDTVRKLLRQGCGLLECQERLRAVLESFTKTNFELTKNANLDQRKFLNSPWNSSLPKRGIKVGIQDFTTDAEEQVGLVVPKENVIKIANKLLEIGVASLAVRAGYGSDENRPPSEVIDCALEIARAHPDKTFPVCGPNLRDIDRASTFGTNYIVIQTTSSNFGLKYKLGIDLNSLISRVVRGIEHAKSYGLKVTYMASDSTRADKKQLKKIITSAENAGCVGLVLSDSNGCATPFGIYDHVAAAKKWTKLPLSIHCHNDYGLATANTIAGISAGAKYAQTCALGVGERSGLASLEEVAVSSEFLFGSYTGLQVSKLVEVCNDVGNLLNYPILPKKPVAGYASTSFEGERFADSLQSSNATGTRLTMMPYLPELVGGKEFLFLGSEAGPKGVRWRLEKQNVVSQLDHKQNERIEAKVADRVKSLARAQQSPVADKQLLELYANVLSGKDIDVGLQLPHILKNQDSPDVKMFEGVTRKTLSQSASMMVVEFKFVKGSNVPMHSHPNEQTGYVASGEVKMTVGETVHNLLAGDSYAIPANLIHGTQALTDSILVDVFHPPRSDYALVRS